LPVPDINIAGIRQDYRLAALDDATAGTDPIAFFSKWFAEASAAHITDVNAMTLATVDEHHCPHARIVLLKGADDQGFTFYTNYDSDKGRQLIGQPVASLVFFWKELERQVRIQGSVAKTTISESDTYFASRPAGSKLGAWASPQSQPINDREVLDRNYAQYQQQFTDDIPRPEWWGGFRLQPSSIEFWQGRSSRMHDRILFKRHQEQWNRYRLAP
jgi:pyridoxamine 5'-phosphate oxidase